MHVSCEDLAYCAVTGGEQGVKRVFPPGLPCHFAGRGSTIRAISCHMTAAAAAATSSYLKREVRGEPLERHALHT